MSRWVYNPHTGGKAIPPEVKSRTEQRIREYGAMRHAGKFIRIDVRFRGALCYIDACTEPDIPADAKPPEGETRDQWLDRLRTTPQPLCRIRYFGDADRWSFACIPGLTRNTNPAF